MSSVNEDERTLLPHHEQQELCTTRLAYRQGRRLTAVKVYTVAKESNHLLIFGIPSLNLRQEAKSLFSKFGKMLQFNISTAHAAEPFSETYHALYEKIQSAKVAKRMLDTKTFYGGSLHVCYAPELENIDETRQKILQRQRDVLYRIKNLQKDSVFQKPGSEQRNDVYDAPVHSKLFMGEVNTINIGAPIKDVCRNKRKVPQEQNIVIEKKFKPCFLPNDSSNSNAYNKEGTRVIINSNRSNKKEKERNECDNTEIEIIDCTSVETETVTNIDHSLNYNKFGNEIIRKIPEKPINKIKFNVGNKK